VRELVSRYWLDVAFGLVARTMLGVALFEKSPAPAPGGTFEPDSVVGRSLARASGKGNLMLDSLAIGGSPAPFPRGAQPVARVKRGQDVVITGWAVDTTASSAAGGLLAQIDGADRVAASYGVARSDVARAARISDVGTGFVLTIPARLLAHGRHSISLLMLNRASTGFYWYPDRLEIDVTK